MLTRTNIPEAGDTRGLYHALWECETTRVYDALLAPWASASRDVLAPQLAVVQEPFADQPARSAWETDKALWRVSWELYALGRVADVLLLAHQPPARPDTLTSQLSASDPIDEPPVSVSAGELARFFAHFGMSTREERSFHPMFHEIVTVIEDVKAEVPRIERIHWPCLMLGELVFARAGVSIRCHPAYASRPWADASTLYWAHCRRHRCASDLSIGWGSNSQWSTRFRRDYACRDRLVFNADGSRERPFLEDRGEPPDPLSPVARERLLVHRCLLHAPPPDSEPWIYDWTLSVRL